MVTKGKAPIFHSVDEQGVTKENGGFCFEENVGYLKSSLPESQSGQTGKQKCAKHSEIFRMQICRFLIAKL